MRFFVYLFAFTATALLLGYGLFVQNGIDPLAPEVRTIMFVSLAVAAYVGLRLAMLVRGFEQRSLARRARDTGDGAGQDTGADTGPDAAARRRGAFSRWGRSSSLDARLDARRERVRRAREAAERAAGEGSGDRTDSSD